MANHNVVFVEENGTSLAPLVKRRLERSAERSKREIKIIFPLFLRRATRSAVQIVRLGRSCKASSSLNFLIQPRQRVRKTAQFIDQLFLYGAASVQHCAHVHHQLPGVEH